MLDDSSRSHGLLRALLSGPQDDIRKVPKASSEGSSPGNDETIQSSFDHYIGAWQFSNFEEFKARLPDFYSLNNVKYKVVRCTPLSVDSPQKATLIYRYMKYLCCFPNCPSYFVLSKRKEHLRISQFNMIHNHPRLPEDYVVMADLSEEFAKLFSQREFESYLAAMKTLRKFEEITGLSFVTGNSQKLKESDPKSSKLIYKRLLLVCVLYESRYKKTAKTGCRASITFVSNDNVIRILAFNMKHNHVCGNDLKMLCKRRTRVEQSSSIHFDAPVIYVDSGLCGSSEKEISSTESLSSSMGKDSLLIFNESPINSFDKLCICLEKFNAVTGSEFIYSHGLRLSSSDEMWTRILFKNIVFICVRAGSDSITCKTRSVRTNCPSRISFRYDKIGFEVWQFNLVHNHKLNKELCDDYSTVVRNNGGRLGYIFTMLSLKIPCQVIQICVKTRFGLSIRLTDIRKLQRKRRDTLDSSDATECDDCMSSNVPDGDNYVGFDHSIEFCGWKKRGHSNWSNKRRKVAHPTPLTTESYPL